MTKLVRSQSYFNDLIEIDNYITLELLNPNAALRIVLDIEAAVERLADFPEMGTELKLSNGINSGLRYIVKEKYVIVYKVEEKEVHLYRVFDCRVDFVAKVMSMLGIK